MEEQVLQKSEEKNSKTDSAILKPIPSLIDAVLFVGPTLFALLSPFLNIATTTEFNGNVIPRHVTDILS